VLIRISQDTLLSALGTVHRAVSSTSPVPALTGILLTATDNKLRLVASDSEISIEHSVEASVESEGGIILPARYFLDIVRKLPSGQDVRIACDQANWTATITWGRSQFVVHGTEPGQFPSIAFDSGSEAINLSQPRLREMIRRTVFAVAQNESRPILTGQLLEIAPSEIRLVSIDGVRLAYCKNEIEQEGLEPQKAVIPGRAMNELARLLSGDQASSCLISVSDNQAFCHLGATRFVSRLLEGQFPPYEQIIPAKFRTAITLDTEHFHDACERASLLSADNDKTIRIEAQDDLLVVTSNTPEVGKVREEMECSVEGDPLEIAFNARFLIEGLRSIDADKIRFEANGPFSPCCIRPIDHENNIYVAMPLRTLGDA